MRRPTYEEIQRWHRQFGNPNVAVVTGVVSNLIVVDCDTVDAARGIAAMLNEPTVMARSGRDGGGTHYYFRHTGGGVRNATAILPGVDIRADGGYVLAPDSIHASGRHYQWLISPWEITPAALPEHLVVLIQKRLPLPVAEQSPLLRESVVRPGGHKILRSELDRLRAIPLPSGNGKQRAMAASAYRLGQLVAGGYLSAQEVENTLLEVWREHWRKPDEHGQRTIQFGLRDGLTNPRILR